MRAAVKRTAARCGSAAALLAAAAGALCIAPVSPAGQGWHEAVARWGYSATGAALLPASDAAIALATTVLCAAMAALVWRRRRDVVFLSLAILAQAMFLCADQPGVASAALWVVYFLATAVDPPSRRRLYCGWAIALTAISIVALCAYAKGYRQFRTPHFGVRASGLYGTPDVLYPLSLAGMFLCLDIAIVAVEPRSRAGAAAGAVIAGAVTLLTFTRSAWVGAAAGLVIPRRARTRRMRLVAAVAAVALVPAAFALRGGASGGPVLDRSAVGRLVIWSSIAAGARDCWLRGCGFQAFTRLAGPDAALRRAGYGGAPADSKNLAIELLLDYGAGGLLLYALWFALVARACMDITNSRTASDIDRALARTTLSLIAALLAAGLTDVPLFGTLAVSPGTVVMLELAGLVSGVTRLGGYERPYACTNGSAQTARRA